MEEVNLQNKLNKKYFHLIDLSLSKLLELLPIVIFQMQLLNILILWNIVYWQFTKRKLIFSTQSLRISLKDMYEIFFVNNGVWYDCSSKALYKWSLRWPSFFLNKNKSRDGEMMTRKWRLLRACLHGCGGPQIGEVTCGGSPHLTWMRDQIKMRDYVERLVTLPKRVTSPSWGPPPPCKQAFSQSKTL